MLTREGDEGRADLGRDVGGCSFGLAPRRSTFVIYQVAPGFVEQPDQPSGEIKETKGISLRSHFGRTRMCVSIIAPRFTVCSGTVLIHVDAPRHSALALEAIRGRAQSQVQIGALAEAAAEILFAGARAFPTQRVRSLRDVLFHGRCVLLLGSAKLLVQLKVACSVARHVSAEELSAQPGVIARELAEVSPGIDDEARCAAAAAAASASGATGEGAPMEDAFLASPMLLCWGQSPRRGFRCPEWVAVQPPHVVETRSDVVALVGEEAEETWRREEDAEEDAFS